MRLERSIVKQLDISDAARKVTTTALDQLPRLISERALEGREGRLTRDVVTAYSAGTAVISETLSMPRRGFGPRPVTLLSPRDRIAFDALVEKLRTALPAESRSPENWSAFRSFGHPGTDATAKYVVSLDIASMYEFVDHAILRTELRVQTLDEVHVEALVDLLGEAFGTPRGLPQMTASSDVLADAYLAILERDLLRHGYELMRYADDFRVLAPDWAIANQIIERAAEVARSIGLILSSEKTSIKKASKIATEQEKQQQVLDKYFSTARSELGTFDDLMDWYGEPVDLDDDTDETAMSEAFRRMLKDWTNRKKRPSLPVPLISKALRSLRSDPKRITDKTLTQLVFMAPLKLSSVLLYLEARPGETEQNWRTAAKLAAMERQSPWAKIWLLTYCSDLSCIETASKHANRVRRWARAQLEDEHEVVRAEAAWALAQWGSLSERDITRLFGLATALSRAGLAAAWGRTGAETDARLSRAICGSSPLYADAFTWGGEQRGTPAQPTS